MQKILFLILIFNFSIIQAQNSFKSLIKDHENKQPLIGANAFLPGTNIGASTDENGRVEIINIPNGQQEIRFSYVGYEEKSLSLLFPLVANHRLNNVLMYEIHDNLHVGLEAYYFSKQKLNDDRTGKEYWIMGLMTEKMFENLSIFLNFENFLDTRQTKFEKIYSGPLTNPVFNDIYAPVDGFVVNGGIKLQL